MTGTNTLADLFGNQSITTVPVVDASGQTFHELALTSDRPLAGISEHELPRAEVIAVDVADAPPHLYRTYCVTPQESAADYAENVAALLRVRPTGDTAGQIIMPDPFTPCDVLTYPFIDAETYGRALYTAISEHGRATAYPYKEN